MTTATRSIAATSMGMIFAINDDLALRALDGLSHEELWKAPTERNNAMLWIAGHIVQTRAVLLGLLGEPFDTGWGERFNRGAVVGDTSLYPSRDEVERAMRTVSQRLQAKLVALDDAELAKPPTTNLPNVKTVADQVRVLRSMTAITLDRWATFERRWDTLRLRGNQRKLRYTIGVGNPCRFSGCCCVVPS